MEYKVYHKDPTSQDGLVRSYSEAGAIYYLNPFEESEDWHYYSYFWRFIKSKYDLSKEQLLNVIQGKPKDYDWSSEYPLPHDIIYHKDENSRTGLVEKGEFPERFYLDPFCENEDWISSHNFSKVVEDYYNLEIWQVWNLIHGFDENFIPKCKYRNCNNKVGFRRLDEGWCNYCSYSCRQLERLEDPEYKKSLQIASGFTSENIREMNLRNWQNPEYYSKHYKRLVESNRDPRNRASLHRFQFINGAKSEIGTFYIAKTSENNMLKFGVSSLDINSLEFKLSRKYISCKSLYKGTIEDVANLEYLIKVNMLKGEYIDLKYWKDFKYWFAKSLEEIKKGWQY